MKKVRILFLVSLMALVSCTGYKAKEFDQGSYYLNKEESLFIINDVVIESYRGMITHVAYNSPFVTVKDGTIIKSISYSLTSEDGSILIGSKIENGIVNDYRYQDYRDVSIQLVELSSKNIKTSKHYYLEVEYVLDGKTINERFELESKSSM